MNKTIRLSDGILLPYELQYKTVKNINLRIRKDSTVTVSAPRRVSEKYIERFLLEKEPFIRRALARLSAVKPQEKPVLADGSTVYLLGEPYTARVFCGTRNAVSLEGKTLLVQIQAPVTEERTQKVFETFVKREFSEVIERVCRSMYPPFAACGVDFPVIKTRRMVSRWGSCNHVKGILCFNTQLYRCPVRTIEYVAVHEFTHFLVHDHSPAFYAQMQRFLADWKERKQELHAFSQAHVLL